MSTPPSRRGLSAGASLLALALATPAFGQETADSLTLDTIDVNAGGATTEGTGAYISQGPTNAAIGLGLTEREIPQSVSIVTQQRILDENLQTLNEAVDSTTGLTAAQGNGEMRWSYYARGSEITNIQYDGIPTYVHFYARDASPQDDLAIYDRIEVVRGATGLLEGTGNPSASINLVRKRPTAEPQFKAEVGVSSFGNASATLDASAPVNAEGTVRYRLVSSGLAGDGYRDNLSDDRALLYGTLDFDLGEATTLSLGASYLKETIDGYSWGGFWTQPDGTFYDFTGSDSPSLSWESSDREQTAAYLDLEHDFGQGWALKVAGRAADNTGDIFSSYSRWESAADGTLSLYRDGGRYDYTSWNTSLGAQVAGPVTLFGRAHELVFGVNGSRDNTRYDSNINYLFVNENPSEADPNVSFPEFIDVDQFWDMTNTSWGVYGAARLTVTDQLKVIGGGRFTWYDYTDDSDWGGAHSYSVDAQPIPYIGAVYDIDDTWSVYASYTGIFLPQQNYGPNGLVDPVEGRNGEVGAKAALFGGQVLATAAVFATEQDGLAEVDPNATGCGPAVDPTCYRNAGLVRTLGAELELAGAITDRWNVFAGYTYATAEYREGDQQGDAFATNLMPRHLLKLSTTYDLPGTFEGLTIGGSLRAQSATYNESDTNTWSSGGVPWRIDQPGYAVVDLMARYALTEATSLQVNVENLFDRTYYTAINEPGYGNFIGEPRSASLLLRHTF